MTDTYKILGKKAPTNTAERVLYSTSVGTEAILTNITVANRSTESKTFDINVVDEALTDNDLVGSATPVNLTIYAETDNYADTSTLKYSTDEVTWQTSTLPSASSWKTFHYLSNKFYAQKNPMMGSAGYATSTDLITWTESTAWGNVSGNAFVVGNNNYCFAPYDDLDNMGTALGIVYNSTDLITWTSASLPSRFYGQNFITHLAYGNGIYLGASNNMSEGYRSTDAVTWTLWTGSTNSSNTGADAYTNYATFSNGMFLLQGTDWVNSVALWQLSTDAITWTDFTAPMLMGSPIAVMGNSQNFLVFDAMGNSAYSTDLVSWNYSTVPVTDAYSRRVTDDTFVIGQDGNGNNYHTSTDGVTWTMHNNPDPTKMMLGTSLVDAVLSSTYATDPVHSLYKGVSIAANTSKILEPGIVLGSENSVLIKGSSGLTFSAYGVELS